MRAITVLVVVAASAAHASPNVALEDPVYDELARLRATGRLAAYVGGFRPLTAARVERLLAAAGEPVDDPIPEGWWVGPIDQWAVRASLVGEHARSYSTSIRPRDLIGAIALSCDHHQGRPCGDGAGIATELDASAGYGTWVSAAVRMRAHTGTADYADGIELDRGYATAELGPAAIELGRDVVVLGPAAHTHHGWGDNAPPLDHVRVATARPFPLNRWLRGTIVYVLGRLRDPQTFSGNLVSIARGQLDIADRVELGMHQELQVRGDGAPQLGVWGFVLEHFARSDPSATATDSSNRRVGFDIAARLGTARLYYTLVFEDWRKHFIDAVHYDADHVLGIELAALGRNALVVEVARTGVRSYEHSPRRTGLTNAGRIAGDPLGPDTQSVFVGGRIAFGDRAVQPWLQLARLSSDTYDLVPYGPIHRVTTGVAELRLRTGAKLRIPLTRELRVEPEVVFERVGSAGFDPTARRNNVGVTATVSWQPRVRRASRTADSP